MKPKKKSSATDCRKREGQKEANVQVGTLLSPKRKISRHDGQSGDLRKKTVKWPCSRNKKETGFNGNLSMIEDKKDRRG